MFRFANKFIQRNILKTGYAKCFCNNSQPRNETTKFLQSDEIKLEQGIITGPFGQPTFTTHPHLMLEGEVLPGIKLSEFTIRRNRLVQIIKQFTYKADKSLQNFVVVIPSAVKKYMSDKIPYTFRQNTDFLYLTGCLEPDCCLVISVIHGVADRIVLFLRPKDKHAELWEGPRTGVENASYVFGIPEAKPMNDLKPFLDSFANVERTFGIWYDNEQCENPQIKTIMNDFTKNSGVLNVHSPTVFVHKLRVIKSKAEINLMKESCRIASKAVNDTMSASRPGVSEQFLFAKVDAFCRELGAQRLAYPPVIAGGSRANIIHYIENNQMINNGDMVLMDAGCEYNSFSSDITRTWPINGKYSEPQKILYHIILMIQNDIIVNIMKEGYPSLDVLFQRMCLLLGTSLQKLGIIDQTIHESNLAEVGYSFCPHHVSHYLGMDVHDTPSISRSIPIQPGMIITIEPGVYIPLERTDVPQEFRGLAVRIEDDILITEHNAEILTDTCVKKIEDVEKLLEQRNSLITTI